MDLSGSKAFYASNAECAGASEHKFEMDSYEVAQRRRLLFWLWKQKDLQVQETHQPLLLRQEWRMDHADSDVFIFA
ncbi:MAG: hypothetical protein AAGF36_16655 [Pseudomonadota bacterium]